MLVGSRVGGVTIPLAFAALLSSCTNDDGAKVVETPEAAVLVAPPAEGGNDARVTGTVAIVDGCLAIGDEVAIWPSGTRVIDPGGPVIDVPGLGTVAVGDYVEGAGGYYRSEDYRGEPRLPASCAGAALVSYRPE